MFDSRRLSIGKFAFVLLSPKATPSSPSPLTNTHQFYDNNNNTSTRKRRRSPPSTTNTLYNGMNQDGASSTYMNGMDNNENIQSTCKRSATINNCTNNITATKCSTNITNHNQHTATLQSDNLISDDLTCKDVDNTSSWSRPVSPGELSSSSSISSLSSSSGDIATTSTTDMQVGHSGNEVETCACRALHNNQCTCLISLPLPTSTSAIVGRVSPPSLLGPTSPPSPASPSSPAIASPSSTTSSPRSPLTFNFNSPPPMDALPPLASLPLLPVPAERPSSPPSSPPAGNTELLSLPTTKPNAVNGNSNGMISLSSPSAAAAVAASSMLSLPYGVPFAAIASMTLANGLSMSLPTPSTMSYEYLHAQAAAAAAAAQAQQALLWASMMCPTPMLPINLMQSTPSWSLPFATQQSTPTTPSQL